MTDNVTKARQWLDILGRGATNEWDGLVAEDMTLHAVAMPGGTPVTGREANREMIGQFWQSWEHFTFHDVEAHAAADDPDLVFVTARSRAETVWGAPYANQYVIRLRFQDGLIRDHREYFDSAPVLQAFKDHLGQ